MLSKIEYERVIITAYELRKFLEQEDNSKNNLHWLFIELLRECGSFWPFLSLYLKTLQKEVSLIKPCDAYEAGLKSYRNDGTPGKAMLAYLADIENRSEVKALRDAVQSGYEYLAKVTGKSGLVQEFVSEYRRIYGPVFSIRFFEAGYTERAARLSRSYQEEPKE